MGATNTPVKCKLVGCGGNTVLARGPEQWIRLCMRCGYREEVKEEE
jgi:hypothetical protein